MAEFKGVDISKHNGNIDFAKLKSQTDFAILRCSIGVPSVDPNMYGTDTKFEQNAKLFMKLDKMPELVTI